MSKYYRTLILIYAVWMAFIGVLYYLADGVYSQKANYLISWLIAVCLFLAYLATKPRSMK